MSWQATTWVIAHSRHKGSELLCLLMIANHTHADGTGAYPSIGTLAAECRMSGRQIMRILERLETSGEILIERNAGPRGVHLMAIPLRALPDKLTPDNLSPPDRSGQEGVTFPTPLPDIAMSPKQSLEQSLGNLSPNGEREPAPPATPSRAEPHPACRSYRRLTGSTLNQARRTVIESAIPEDVPPEDLARWEAAITAWAGRGYRRENVAGMLEWYREGVPPLGNGRGTPLRPVPATRRVTGADALTAGFEREQEEFTRHARNASAARSGPGDPGSGPYE